MKSIVERNIRLITSPTVAEMEIVENWLYEESKDKSCQYAFYGNLDIIKAGVRNNRTFICNFNDKPIGFVHWLDVDRYIEINLFVISKSQRGNGIGAVFYKLLYEYFRDSGYIALHLYCKPAESVTFWRDKLNFIYQQRLNHSQRELTFYKPLIDIRSESETSIIPNKLELWDVESYAVNEAIQPKWVWDVGCNDLSMYPILQPCNPDWNLRLTLNGVLIKEDRVKKFKTSYNNEVYIGTFLFLDSL